MTWRDILGYALRRTGTEADAADIVAEVFSVAWRRRHDIPAGERARLWLYGVARHALSNQRRGELRRGNLAASLAANLSAGVRHAESDPSVVVAARLEAAKVLQALACLPELDRELLTLVAWDGLSPAQASAVLGLSAGAGRVRLHRARQRLMKASREEPQRGAVEPRRGEETTASRRAVVEERPPQRGAASGHVLGGGLFPAPAGNRLGRRSS